MSNPRLREGSLLSKVTQLGHLAGEEQTQDDFGKLAHREEVRLVLYDPKGTLWFWISTAFSWPVGS